MENAEVITHIVKRDGTIQHFDSKKITNAISKAAEVTGEFDNETAKKLTIRVINIIQQLYGDGYIACKRAGKMTYNIRGSIIAI